MKLNKFSILFCAVLGLLLATSAFSQGSTFSDPNVDYTFELPEDSWKITAKPSATNPNVEYVNNERKEGHLGVRKLTVGKTDAMSDIIRDDEVKLRFQMGYVAGKEEVFSGYLKGAVFNYEYVASGLNMSGRFYYLRANDTTVYVLRFTGLQNKLKTIRNQTDMIARSFKVKKAA
jgi:hypothetical protein